MDGPVFLHLVTKKGKGFPLAEKNPDKYHGVGPYCPQEGIAPKNGNITWSDVFGSKLCKMASSDNRIVAITAAMAEGTGLKEFSEKFPNRFVDVGIAEQHAVTFAGGLAVKGLKPYVAIYSTFMQRAMDQVIHDIALQKLPVVFCMDRAGLVGNDGPTHHGVFDISLFTAIPDMVVLAPSSAEELELMMDFADAYQAGPVAIRYPRGNVCRIKHETNLTLGKAALVKKGKALAIIGLGEGFNIGQELWNLCKQTPTLVDARFAKPLDELLYSKIAAEHDTIITIETNALINGFGAQMSELLINCHADVYSYGIPDRFITQGNNCQLMQEIGLTAEQIYQELLIKKIITEQ
jgi:1-deoxy-D-xylulose-5-phosphate synthase